MLRTTPFSRFADGDRPRTRSRRRVNRYRESGSGEGYRQRPESVVACRKLFEVSLKDEVISELNSRVTLMFKKVGKSYSEGSNSDFLKALP